MIASSPKLKWFELFLNLNLTHELKLRAPHLGTYNLRAITEAMGKMNAKRTKQMRSSVNASLF